MSHFDHLPDDATRFTPAHLRSRLARYSDDHTLLGWIGLHALVAMLLGAGVVCGGLLGPVLYRLLN